MSKHWNPRKCKNEFVSEHAKYLECPSHLRNIVGYRKIEGDIEPMERTRTIRPIRNHWNRALQWLHGKARWGEVNKLGLTVVFCNVTPYKFKRKPIQRYDYIIYTNHKHTHTHTTHNNDLTTIRHNCQCIGRSFHAPRELLLPYAPRTLTTHQQSAPTQKGHAGSTHLRRNS